MSVTPLVRAVEEEHLRADVPEMASGDTVRVHVKVVEGSRERIQVFEGIVIRHHGEGLNRCVHRPSHRAWRGRRAVVSDEFAAHR